MAALAPANVDQPRKSYEQKQGPTSHGRGGAGNIKENSNDTPVDPSTFITPTIKSAVYTTGRGGNGNMAKNDSAEEARRAQDVLPVQHKDPATQNQHVGRGGGGNVYRASTPVTETSNEDGAVNGHAHKKSLAEKAKEFLAGKK